MAEQQDKSLREIIDSYSPIVRGRKGILGGALKVFAAPLEAVRSVKHALKAYPFHFGHENTAGQIVTDCPAIIPTTFVRMEHKLQASFNTAARPEATPIERESFLGLANTVRAEAEVLGRHCTILRTEFDNVTEPYRFILRREKLDNGDTKLTSLEDGVAMLRQELYSEVPTKPEAHKPVTIRRKPILLPKPDEGAQPGF
jgi:hypothetical protein